MNFHSQFLLVIFQRMKDYDYIHDILSNTKYYDIIYLSTDSLMVSFFARYVFLANRKSQGIFF